jgi:hypothetical protein
MTPKNPDDDATLFSQLTPEEKRRAYELVETIDPEAWKACYPRIYKEPTCGRYHSPKEPARQLASIALKINQGMIGPSEQYEFLVASQLVRFQVPTFWLSEDIAQAIRKTVPPQAIEWYDMPLPFEAGCFMLPKGSLVHPTEGDVVFVAYARFKTGERLISNLVKGMPYGSENGGMTLIALTLDGHLIHWNIPLNAYGRTLTLPDMEDLVFKYTGPGQEHASGMAFLRQPHMSEDDHRLVVEVAHMVFGSILLMNSRPDLITHGQRIKSVAKKGKTKEFWSPNILGESYKLRREAGEPTGTHASPRFHWVRGAYREQPYGPGREFRKTLWVEPYVRGVS